MRADWRPENVFSYRSIRTVSSLAPVQLSQPWLVKERSGVYVSTWLSSSHYVPLRELGRTVCVVVAVVVDIR
jgi:hypothetical protein